VLIEQEYWNPGRPDQLIGLPDAGMAGWPPRQAGSFPDPMSFVDDEDRLTALFIVLVNAPLPVACDTFTPCLASSPINAIAITLLPDPGPPVMITASFLSACLARSTARSTVSKATFWSSSNVN
jgi:hypothetical protein